MKTIFRDNKFAIGFFLFTIFNLIQAVFLEINYDEAYYWVYANFPDWGYFDHPPMVGWLVYLGKLIFPGTFGVRFFFIAMASTALLLIWKMIKEYKDDPVLFWAIVFSITLFIPYTFFAVPDVPMFFFTVVFFYIYRQFLKKETFLNAVLFGLVAALLLYSKYHAVLVFFFTFLSNLKLIRCKYAWLAVGSALFFTMPHWYWQYLNNYPSIHYQLIGNHQKVYTIWANVEFLVGQLFATGVLTGWLFLYSATKVKTENKWEAALKFNFIGIFVFFFLTTFSGDIENHWTFVAYIPMLILVYIFMIKNEKWRRLTLKLGLISFILFTLFRAAFIIVGSSTYVKALNRHFYNEAQYSTLHDAIGDYPVVTQTTYAKAALYAYYADKAQDTYAMSSGFYHRTQFDFYPTEDRLQGKTIYYIDDDTLKLQGEYQTVPTIRRDWYIKKVENF